MSSLTARLLARCRFPAPGTAVSVGWSGGPDSTALVVLAQAAGCVVSAVHVDHGIRAEGDDRAVIERLAARLAVPLHIVAVAVGDGPDLEARARAARHRVLPPGTLLGHTADDQAETLLLNLARGAGPRGLGAMPDDGRRPLLRLRRHETRALCDDRGLAVYDDPTNDDPRFRRNRVRLELLPLLGEIFERDPVPVLDRVAGHQREVTALLDQLADRLDCTDTRELRQQPELVVRHGLQRWIREGSGADHPVDAATLDRVLDVVHHRCRATEVGEGWRLERHQGRLHLHRPRAVVPAGDVRRSRSR